MVVDSRVDVEIEQEADAIFVPIATSKKQRRGATFANGACACSDRAVSAQHAHCRDPSAGTACAQQLVWWFSSIRREEPFHLQHSGALLRIPCGTCGCRHLRHLPHNRCTEFDCWRPVCWVCWECWVSSTTPLPRPPFTTTLCEPRTWNVLNKFAALLARCILSNKCICRRASRYGASKSRVSQTIRTGNPATASERKCATAAAAWRRQRDQGSLGSAGGSRTYASHNALTSSRAARSPYSIPPGANMV